MSQHSGGLQPLLSSSHNPLAASVCTLAHSIRRFCALGVAVGLLSAAMLGGAANASEFSAARLGYTGAVIDGLRGNQGIRTDPATVVGVGYVHITQVDIGLAGGDFVAIGTANGLGVANCANDYDARWTVYSDGVLGGVYFCNDHQLDAYGAGSNPAFSITWGWCPSASANRWLLSFGGTLWTCKNSSSVSGVAANVGIETTGTSTVDRNIDAKYTNLQKNLTGSTSWSNYGTSPATIVDPSYSLTIVSSTAINAFLAPLD